MIYDVKAQHDAAEYVRQYLVAYSATRALTNANLLGATDDVVEQLSRERDDAMNAMDDLKEALPLYDLPPVMLFIWNDEFHVLHTETLEVTINVGLYNL